MKKSVLLSLICALFMLVAFSGCNKDIKVPTDVKSAATAVGQIFTQFNKIAADSGDDCGKLGTGLTEYLNKNKDALTAGMKILSAVDENSEEGKAAQEQLKVLDNDDSDLNKKMEKCGEDPAVMGFSMALLGILMSAAPADAADDDDAKDKDED